MSPQNRQQKRPHGQLRLGQVLTTFGPGAILDLPDRSGIVAGLDYWSYRNNLRQILEPRLARRLEQIVGTNGLRLQEPPATGSLGTSEQGGITVYWFPEWFTTQEPEDDPNRPGTRRRRLLHRNALTNANKPKPYFQDSDGKKHSVVPVRFVRACISGHIGDIDWFSFLHGSAPPCGRPMWMLEEGTSGDLSEISVFCECGKERALYAATGDKAEPLGLCDGSRPWLGPNSRERCGERNRLLIRTASNAYFPVTMRVISLPDTAEAARTAIVTLWDFLSEVQDAEEVKKERNKPKVKAGLVGISDEEAFAAIEALRTGSQAQDEPPKIAELRTLTKPVSELGKDEPESKFLARALDPVLWQTEPWMQPFERIVFVQRLTEVTAQLGFSRFEPVAPHADGDVDLGARRASLAREADWLPAVENRGEGIFLQFSVSCISEWLARDAVGQWGQRLRQGTLEWLKSHKNSKRQFPGLPYFMLHSFSHLLLTAISLECGYPASSIRERVYAFPDVGYGVLLYTASSDAEGTLGGLVEVGREIPKHIRRALTMGELCSNDPICAQHDPADAEEARYLLGAACHGCLLIAETSCEMMNDFLDRSLVVETVERKGAEFFNPEWLL